MFQASDTPSSKVRTRLLKPSEIEDAVTDASSASSEPLTHVFAYSLKGLQAQTWYSVAVQTRNEAGWSPVSEEFQFVTSAIGKGGI